MDAQGTRAGVIAKRPPLQHVKETGLYYLGVLRDRGLTGFLKRLYLRALLRLHYLAFDRLSGGDIAVATSRCAAISKLPVIGSNQRHAIDYEPTPVAPFYWLRTVLPKDRDRWTFVDIGAGKGRTLALASTLGFEKVVGIEFADSLCAEARDMLRAQNLDTDGRIRVETADATAFDVPDGPCVFYLFTPFGAEVVRGFLDNVLASHARNPRPMLFVYYYPAQAQEFETRPTLREVALPALLALKLKVASPYSARVFEVRDAAKA